MHCEMAGWKRYLAKRPVPVRPHLCGAAGGKAIDAGRVQKKKGSRHTGSPQKVRTERRLQTYLTRTFCSDERRRIAKPTPSMPRMSIIQVAGSGTAWNAMLSISNALVPFEVSQSFAT